MQDCKPTRIPQDASSNLTKDMEVTTTEEIDDMKNVPYHNGVGIVMCAIVGTCPDLAGAVGATIQFMSNGGKFFWSN